MHTFLKVQVKPLSSAMVQEEGEKEEEGGAGNDEEIRRSRRKTSEWASISVSICMFQSFPCKYYI